jgi:hypothetical protein
VFVIIIDELCWEVKNYILTCSYVSVGRKLKSSSFPFIEEAACGEEDRNVHARAHTHTHTYIYIYIYIVFLWRKILERRWMEGHDGDRKVIDELQLNKWHH